MTRWELQELFETYHYPVVTASSGEEAVELARTQTIGLLLADIRMAGMDGIDASHAIQQMQPDVPVILFTAYSEDSRYRQRVRDAGLKVSAWIPKALVNIRDQLLLKVKYEMDRRLMRDMVTAWTSRGLSLTAAWAALEAMLPMLELSEEAFRDLKEELSPPDSPQRVLSDLSRALANVREHLNEIEERQFPFDKLKDIALSRLHSVYEHFDQDTRRMALLIRMAVRQMKGLTLTSEQFDVLEYTLTKLADNEVGTSSRRDCRRRLRRAGIETMVTLGPRTPELIEIYDEYDESEGEP